MRLSFPGLLTVALLILNACASQAVGKHTSQLALPEGVNMALEKPAPVSDALVTLRYPAVVSPEAQQAFTDAFIARAIGGRPGTDLNEADAGRIATSMVAKTNFFAMSLYANLREALPEGTVILSPHAITVDVDGRLSSEPLMQSETLPSVLTVDFSPYSFPDSAEMMNAPPLTFGDLITPMLVVHTDHRAKPETYGLIMASEPLINAAYQEAKAAAYADIQGALAQTNTATPTRRLDIIAFLDGAGAETPPTGPLDHKTNIGAVQSLKVEKLTLPAGAMTQMSIDPKRPFDPLEVRYSNYATSRIIDALNDIDHDRATVSARIDALARYDTEVAGLYLSGLDNREVSTRLAFADKLLEAERKYIAAQSDAIYNGTFAGERGQQMRQILVSEWLALDERRRLARQQNAQTAFAVLAVAAAAYAASEAGNSTTRTGRQTAAVAGQIAANAAALSGFRAVQARTQSQAIGANTLIALSPVLEEQIAVQLEFIDGTEEISAASFADFREQMVSLYDTRIGEISLVAETCAFADGGVWTGQCENGVASGKGRGIYTDPNGQVVEYFGDAKNGVPHGVGYKLVASETAPLAWEGVFQNGLLNGEATRYAPGAKPTGHVYEDGTATKSIPSNRAPRLFGDGEPGL